MVDENKIQVKLSESTNIKASIIESTPINVKLSETTNINVNLGEVINLAASGYTGSVIIVSSSGGPHNMTFVNGILTDYNEGFITRG